MEKVKYSSELRTVDPNTHNGRWPAFTRPGQVTRPREIKPTVTKKLAWGAIVGYVVAVGIVIGGIVYLVKNTKGKKSNYKYKKR